MNLLTLKNVLFLMSILYITQAQASTVFVTNNTNETYRITQTGIDHNPLNINDRLGYIELKPLQTAKLANRDLLMAAQNKTLVSSIAVDDSCVPVVLKQNINRWYYWYDFFKLAPQYSTTANFSYTQKNGYKTTTSMAYNTDHPIKQNLVICNQNVSVSQMFHTPARWVWSSVLNLKIPSWLTRLLGLESENLYYVIQPKIKAANPSDPLNENELNVLSYNIYSVTAPIFDISMKPLTLERSKLIPDHVLDNDVVAFSEVFNARGFAILDAKMKANGFEYSTNVLNTDSIFELGFQRPRLTNGGVVIFSRYPILNGRGDQHFYKNCSGEDCLSPKGVMYAKISKNNKIYHVFATHTQAWLEQHETRAKQLKEMKSFIDSRGIQSSEPVIMAGDFNVDLYDKDGWEYDQMLSILNADEPEYQEALSPNEKNYTFDLKLNNLVAMQSGATNEYLDYILTSKEHQIPLKNLNEIQKPRSDDLGVWSIWDLSDHYPIQSKLKF